VSGSTLGAPTVDPKRLHAELGVSLYCRPEPFGPDGWSLVRRSGRGSVIVTAAEFEDGHVWVHASVSDASFMPSYRDLQALHRAAFGDGYAYQVFAPPADHVNIHAHALHLWGRADGARVLPDFGVFGSI
jgi:hypothetical protein